MARKAGNNGSVDAVLGVAADQFVILGEGHVTFYNASTHPCCCQIGFSCVLGKLQSSSTMPDGKIPLAYQFLLARNQFIFQWTIIHVPN